MTREEKNQIIDELSEKFAATPYFYIASTAGLSVAEANQFRSLCFQRGVEYKVFNLGQIETLIEKYSLASFSMENLYVNGLVNRTDKVKILGNGAISTKIDFKVNAISEKAKSVIEAAGGSVEIIK